MRQTRQLPLVLSAKEVALLLGAAPGPKYRAALGAAYGAGLRVAEVVAPKVGDVDRTRMLQRVDQGKGRKDRYAMLSPQLTRRPCAARGWRSPTSCVTTGRPGAGPFGSHSGHDVTLACIRSDGSARERTCS